MASYVLGVPTGDSEDPNNYLRCLARERSTYFAPDFTEICGLVIGSPKVIIVGQSNPLAPAVPQSDPGADRLAVQNVVYVNNIGGGEKGFIVASGARLTRDEQVGDNVVAGFTEMAAYDVNLNLKWRTSAQASDDGSYWYDFYTTRLAATFPGGKLGYIAPSLANISGRLEFFTCTPLGDSRQDYAFAMAPPGTPVSAYALLQDIVHDPGSDAIYVQVGVFNNIKIVKFTNPMEPAWAFTYDVESPFNYFYVSGLSLANSGGSKIFAIAQVRNTLLTGVGGYVTTQSMLYAVDPTGAVVFSKVYQSHPVGSNIADYQIVAEFDSATQETLGTLLVAGRVSNFSTGTGDQSAFIARIDASTGNVIASKNIVVPNYDLYGEFYDMAFVQQDTDGFIYISGSGYIEVPEFAGADGGAMQFVYKLNAALELVGATAIQGVSIGINNSGSPILAGKNIIMPILVDGVWWQSNVYSLQRTDGACIILEKNSIGVPAGDGDVRSVQYGNGPSFLIRDITSYVTAVAMTSLTPLDIAMVRSTGYCEPIAITHTSGIKDPAYDLHAVL